MRSQHFENFISARSTHFMLNEQFPVMDLRRHRSVFLRGCTLPKFSHLELGQIFFQLKELQIVAPQHLVDLVDQSHSAAGQMFCGSTWIPELQNGHRGGFQITEELDIGARTSCQHIGVEVIIFDTGQRER